MQDVEDIRDEMNRAGDMARGLGTELSAADLRYYGEQMAYASIGDTEHNYFMLALDDVQFYAPIEAEWLGLNPARAVLHFIDAVMRLIDKEDARCARRVS